MPIESMKDTRQRGDSKRFETICSLVNEVHALPKWTSSKQVELIDRAVANASGLRKESSRKTFRYECELALDSDVVANFDDILEFTERVWDERKAPVFGKYLHSKYHVLTKILKLLTGGRRFSARRYSFQEIAEYYDQHGELPWN